MDRGYFPRHGLFDRRYNPRLASYVYRHLQGFLARLAEPLVLEDMSYLGRARIGWAVAGSQRLGLVLPEAHRETPIPLPRRVADRNTVEVINLETGIIEPNIANSICPRNPSLIVFQD